MWKAGVKTDTEEMGQAFAKEAVKGWVQSMGLVNSWPLQLTGSRANDDILGLL